MTSAEFYPTLPPYALLFTLLSLACGRTHRLMLTVSGNGARLKSTQRTSIRTKLNFKSLPLKVTPNCGISASNVLLHNNDPDELTGMWCKFVNTQVHKRRCYGYKLKDIVNN